MFAKAKKDQRNVRALGKLHSGGNQLIASLLFQAIAAFSARHLHPVALENLTDFLREAAKAVLLAVKYNVTENCHTRTAAQGQNIMLIFEQHNRFSCRLQVKGHVTVTTPMRACICIRVLGKKGKPLEECRIQLRLTDCRTVGTRALQLLRTALSRLHRATDALLIFKGKAHTRSRARKQKRAVKNRQHGFPVGGGVCHAHRVAGYRLAQHLAANGGVCL